jgi:6,7-dimethyl-8-ribityllumazine synthase
MPNVFQGDRSGAGPGRWAVVVSRYNESITGKLLDGAVATLAAAGVADDAIDVAWVPGAWEIPLVAGQLAGSGGYCAVLCLGAVIKGETTHDQHINRQVSLSLGRISLKTGVPVLFGVLTCNSIEQAIHRSGGNVGNKGVECAEAALEMASLLRKLPAVAPEHPRPFEQAEREPAAAPESLGTKPPAVKRPVAERIGRKRLARLTRRSRARQVALQVLFADDLNPQHDLLTGSADFLQTRLRSDRELVRFAQQLVDGVRHHRQEIDRILAGKLQHWSLTRLAATDRSVLRMGVYELLFAGTPGPVAINEAIELARRFGSPDSPKFVNGVLDQVLCKATEGN